jgi:hypothetical protein
MVIITLGLVVAVGIGLFRSDPATRNCRLPNQNRRPAAPARSGSRVQTSAVNARGKN